MPLAPFFGAVAAAYAYVVGQGAVNYWNSAGSTGVLKLGSVGVEVQAVQQTLRALGYHVQPSGVFDAPTDAAVRQFQASRGLRVDGLVGEQTRMALGGPAPGAASSAGAPAGAAAPSAPGYSVAPGYQPTPPPASSSAAWGVILPAVILTGAVVGVGLLVNQARQSRR